MKLSTCLIVVVLIVTGSYRVNGQTVEKSKIKFGGYGAKKFNKGGKKVFIEQFDVSYQYIYAKSTQTRGGRQAGGGYLGNAKAALFLGLDGITPEQLQEITDKAYKDFTDKLEKKGFSILTGEDFKAHAYYAGSNSHKGGEPHEYYKGFISTSPSDITFLFKEYGIFNTSLKTSKQLDGVIIARINIMVPFAEDGESQGSRALTKSFGGVAKVVAKPNLRIGSTSIQSKSKLGFDKYRTIGSMIDIGFQKSLKEQAWQTAVSVKGIKITGVLPNKKYKAVKSAGQDLDGTQVGNYRVFNIPDNEIKKMQIIKIDGKKYKKGVQEAFDYYIGTTIDKFLSNFK